MRILVFGAGAIGSVLGGLLKRAGHDVALLGRAWHVDVVRRQGLLIEGLWGCHQIDGLKTATDRAAAEAYGPFDWVLCCVKSHQTAPALEDLAALAPAPSLVCAFQNGVGNYETLLQRLPPERLALARVIFGAELEPGRVRVTVCADDVVIGSPDARCPSDRIEQLTEALRASGVPARTTTAILEALWAKVLYNCSLNGLSTLLEVPYGALPHHPLARQLIEAVIREVYAVAQAGQVVLTPPTPQAYAELLFTRLVPLTGAHLSSMLQDVRRGRLTEIEAMNGAIVRLARDAGLRAPANELLTRLVHAKEQFAGAE